MEFPANHVEGRNNQLNWEFLKRRFTLLGKQWEATGGSQTLTTGSSTTATLSTVSLNEDNLFTLSSNNVTCQYPGVYLFTAQNAYDANATGSRATWFEWSKTGSSRYGNIEYQAPTSAGNGTSALCTWPFRMAVGEYIYLVTYQASGGNLASTSRTVHATLIGF